MTWFFWQLSSTLILSANSILDKRFVQRHNSNSILYLFSFAVVGLPVSVLGMCYAPIPSPEIAGTAIGSGFIFAIAIMLYYQAMNLDQVSRLTPILRLSSIVRLGLLAVFLGDRLSLMQYTSYGVILVGILVLMKESGNHSQPASFRIGRGAFLMSTVAALLAIEGLLSARATLVSSPWVNLVWSNVGTILGTAMILISRQQRLTLWRSLRTSPIRFQGMLVGQQTSRVVTTILSNLAIYSAGSAAIVTLLDGVRPLMVLVLAAIFLNEPLQFRTSKSKLVSTALISIGTILTLVGGA